MIAPAQPTAPIDGAALLNEVETFHRRFNVFPTEAAYVAVTLWDAHAHLVECFETTPRIAFLSPEPGSGKSRALEIVELLTPGLSARSRHLRMPCTGWSTPPPGCPPCSSTRWTPSSARRQGLTRRCAAS